MIIHIMDPGLRDLTGHHYDFVSRLYRQLTEKGHSVSVYANASCRLDNVIPHFRSFPYPQHHGEILDYHHHSRLIQEDLSNIPDADYWIWPSVFSFQVNGVRLANRPVKSVGCVHVEHDYHHSVYGAAQWQDAQYHNFKIFAMEHKLVQDYLDIDIACSYAPNPADNFTEPCRTQLKTIGFFGHQRTDKGSNNVLNIVAQLADRYHIILHDSAGVLQYQHSNVACYGAVPVLSDIIRQCDLTVLPYNRTKYRKMSSGILCESLSVGIPCVVPSDTTLADWVNITGAGVVFDYSILDAITTADSQYADIAHAAYQTSVKWPEQYGIAKFLNTLVEI